MVECFQTELTFCAFTALRAEAPAKRFIPRDFEDRPGDCRDVFRRDEKPGRSFFDSVDGPAGIRTDDRFAAGTGLQKDDAKPLSHPPLSSHPDLRIHDKNV